ncbi:class I SAM-dependent methyltransferase [Kitasatospora sp. NPDC059795]|uniref:class I SAM-dependent methyltransferase n=1 Tax=Kitasatospora sp. NPDC059795 TaxID=3346949 RepID=UPI00365EA6B1
MTSMSDLEKISANREGFNLRARAHMQSSYYNVEQFKQGHNMLRKLEREELGDVSGKTLLELQCHIGVNSLSLARMGAKVTGTDISDEAVDIARGLAAELDLDAQFVQANLYDLPGVLDGQFDMVFTGYGTLSFLPDIDAWAKVATQYVKPGGTLTVVEIHPMLTLMGDVDGELRIARSLFRSRDVHHEMSSTYSDRIEDEVEVETHSIYGWRWSIEQVVNALINAGMTIERIREVPYDARQRLPLMVPDGDHNWRIPGDPIPLSFSCIARRA